MIPLLYSDKHHLHAPRVEFYHDKVLNYPEVPARAEIIKDHLLGTGLVALLEPQTTLPRQALLKVHDEGMIAHLENIESEIRRRVGSETGTHYQLQDGDLYLYPSVFSARSFMMRLKDSPIGKNGYYFFDNGAPLGKGSWAAILSSASLAYEGAALLMRGEAKVAYALCRPPGHHAGRDFMGGYCYINNAAVAGSHLMQMGRVALLDIDYHHGNGSQAIFWDEPQVFFASIHGHPAEEYPYYSGYADETGGATAPNGNFNIPLSGRVSSQQFLAAFAQVLDRTKAFHPSAVVLSLGFDTYQGDPLSPFQVTPEAYRQVGQMLMELNLPVLIIQEGGYQVEALGKLAEQVLRGITGAISPSK
jgi:acetoin utilization deacetylase AcuC-like enzyme